MAKARDTERALAVERAIEEALTSATEPMGAAALLKEVGKVVKGVKNHEYSSAVRRLYQAGRLSKQNKTGSLSGNAPFVWHSMPRARPSTNAVPRKRAYSRQAATDILKRAYPEQAATEIPAVTLTPERSLLRRMVGLQVDRIQSELKDLVKLVEEL